MMKMTENKRFKIYDKETWDTRIEDMEDCYDDGGPRSYWFGENEDFCDLFDKLNELSDENKQLKKENKKLICIMKQLEAKYEDKGFSLAYDMEECE